MSTIKRRDFITNYHATSYDYISPLKLDISGRNVIITGGASQEGVGSATAIAFARAGAKSIAIIDIHDVMESTKEKIKKAALDAERSESLVISCKTNISLLNEVQAAYDTISKVFDGRLDVLINNAAHQEPYATILASDPEVYWRTWEVNLHGVFNMTRLFLPMLLSTRTSNDLPGSCTMINVSSSGALSVRGGSSSYRSSKLALLRWTENTQLDHLDQGLLTFCVNPGAIKTQLTINEPEELRAKLPHKSYIAGDTICWLASERREWLSARYISCPWDMEELMSRKEEIVEGDKLKIKMDF
ncbi:uncharacterized protein L201_008059 [Kwoniella dendrophila CBS 6074]|uniref:NAD(P)-binding protein n=1 Tax=Kwoniella dendrophila CBS 6074 TaxID=1295534 RepID=A0AAX4K7I8_9TREE